VARVRLLVGSGVELTVGNAVGIGAATATAGAINASVGSSSGTGYD
jgi:hypothetical protein